MKTIRGNRPSAVGVDIFAGGFTCGVIKHFDVLAHLEHGPYGVKTARLNFPDLPIVVDPKEWDATFKKLRSENPSFIYGNPPCAIWSAANGRKGHTWKDDPRTSCITDIVGLLRHGPKVLVWESVTNAWTRGGVLLRQQAERALEAGYSVTHVLHDGRHLGLPHTRKRYFYVAHKVELDFDVRGGPPLTVQDVLEDLDPGEPWHQMPKSFEKLWDRARPGATFRQYVSDKEWRDPKFTKPGFFSKKLVWDEPAHTIMHPQTSHPKEKRYLTFNEFKALCSYPPEFKLADRDLHSLFRAVMPTVGAWIAKVARKGIDANRRINRHTENFVDLRDPDNKVFRKDFRNGAMT